MERREAWSVGRHGAHNAARARPDRGWGEPGRRGIERECGGIGGEEVDCMSTLLTVGHGEATQTELTDAAH
jgi:hypothetical protein